MDSLKTLMDRQDYELVIKLTENSEDTTSLFYRVAAFVGSNHPKEALACIEKNRKILEKDMSVLIKLHIETLCIVGDFDKAYEELKYYENLPYVSQEVEELLKEMPKYIRAEEKRALGSKELDTAGVKKLLHSGDYNDVLIGLDIVRGKDLNDFIIDIKDLMKNYPKQSIRSFSLFILVQREYDKEVEFNHMGEIIKLVPKDTEPPFVGEKFNSLVKDIQMTFKNPVLAETAVNALSTHIMYTYPEPIKEDPEALKIALYRIACEYTSTLDKSSLEDKQHHDNGWCFW